MLANIKGCKTYLASGPEWESFSALEFHALDRPNLLFFCTGLFSATFARSIIHVYL